MLSSTLDDLDRVEAIGELKPVLVDGVEVPAGGAVAEDGRDLAGVARVQVQVGAGEADSPQQAG